METLEINTKIAYVSAWDYDSGGGFDWFYTKESADTAFELEKLNCVEFKLNEWVSYRFDIPVPSVMSDYEVTNRIDSDLRYFCDNAPVNYKAVL